MEIPYAVTPRPDTGVTNARLGMWLFLASEVMLFGSLFSAYAILRTGAAAWPDQSALVSLPAGVVNTLLLLAGSIAMARARAATGSRARALTAATALLGVAFLALKALEWTAKLRAGLLPSAGNFLGLYFAMTGLHALHVLGGVLALGWLALRPVTAANGVRTGVAALYWHFVDVVWICLFTVFYLL